MKQLIKDLKFFASKQFAHDVNNLIGREVDRLIQEGFDQQKDPYGRKWKPNLEGNRILHKSGKLRSSIKWRADSRAVYFKTTTRYANIHNRGGVIKAKKKPFLVF